MNNPAGRHLVIDESMDCCTSRCAHTHKIPRKPIKQGLKYYYLCNEYGYIHNINLHTREVLPYDAARGPLFSRTFMMLSGQNVHGGQSFLNCHRTIFTDRLFTSPVLAAELLAYDTYIVGTVVATRQYLPSTTQAKMNKSIARGTFVFRHADPFSCVCWFDSNVVKLLYDDPEYLEQVSVIQRRTHGSAEVLNLPVPDVIVYYQQYMRGY